MGRRLTREEHLDAPMERVGGALERVLSTTAGWRLGALDREGGTLEASFRARLGGGDQLRAAVAPDGAGTRLTVELETARPLARLAPRRARLAELLSRVRQMLHDG